MSDGARGPSTTRLDSFVDAAFAFAVTLLLISGAPPSDLTQMKTALGSLPASATAFCLIAGFWGAHRSFGRLATRRNRATVLLSLAIVFVVLTYVFPLRLIIQSGFYWMSAGRLPGEGLIHTWNDLRDLYLIYGLGFAVLSALFAALFGQAAQLADIDAHRGEARSSRDAWGVCALMGVISAVLAVSIHLPAAPWLPPTMYWLLPLAIWGIGVLRRRNSAAVQGARL